VSAAGHEALVKIVLSTECPFSDDDRVERCARYRADNFSVCCCWMCGNPRRLRNSNGPSLTVQERLADLREQVLLDEGSDG
jgi:hypothetical protein